MKKHLGLVCSVALLFGTAAFAGDKYKDNDNKAKTRSTETTTDTKTTTNDKTTKTSSDTVVGKVKSYEPGKSIEVTVPGKIKTSRTFDLTAKDTSASVDPSVAVGSRVKVVQRTDNNGHKTITVEPQHMAKHKTAT